MSLSYSLLRLTGSQLHDCLRSPWMPYSRCSSLEACVGAVWDVQNRKLWCFWQISTEQRSLLKYKLTQLSISLNIDCVVFSTPTLALHGCSVAKIMIIVSIKDVRFTCHGNAVKSKYKTHIGHMPQALNAATNIQCGPTQDWKLCNSINVYALHKGQKTSTPCDQKINTGTLSATCS